MHGPYRGRIENGFSPVILNETYIKNNIGTIWINKIHGLLLTNDYYEFEQTIDRYLVKNDFQQRSLFPERKLIQKIESKFSNLDSMEL